MLESYIVIDNTYLSLFEPTKRQMFAKLYDIALYFYRLASYIAIHITLGILNKLSCITFIIIDAKYLTDCILYKQIKC